MIKHIDISTKELRSKIKQNEICCGGNKRLKIYGTLQCKSGKRMKRENRVFFVSKKEPVNNGYRPCGHCMKTEYQKWIYSTQE
jgi:methylphosphotriester-DNA--protein-cysteine methyltransferase